MFEIKQTKAAAIGDPDILIILQSGGVEIFAARHEAEARQAVQKVIENRYGLCFIQQDFYLLAVQEKEKREGKLETVFVPLVDYRQEKDLIHDLMREMSLKATGSDTLFKRNR